MSSRREFNEMFYKTCMPILAKFENERQRSCRLLMTVRIVVLILLIFAFILLVIYNNNELAPIFAVVLAILTATLIMLFTVSSDDKALRAKKIKQAVMPAFCKCLGDFRWSSNFKTDLRLMANIGIIPAWYDALVINNDFLKGKYKDIPIEIRNINCCYKAGSFFQGIITTIEMNKNFEGLTLVTNDALIKQSPLMNVKHTELEDSNFEKIFDVYTEDEVEARYLLTPSFMERIVKVKKTFMAAKVSCAFYMNKLFISIHTGRDMFSLESLENPADDYRLFLQMFREISSIIELIDQLKLDQKIGL